jgi:hypothetical protein
MKEVLLLITLFGAASANEYVSVHKYVMPILPWKVHHKVRQVVHFGQPVTHAVHPFVRHFNQFDHRLRNIHLRQTHARGVMADAYDRFGLNPFGNERHGGGGILGLSPGQFNNNDGRGRFGDFQRRHSGDIFETDGIIRGIGDVQRRRHDIRDANFRGRGGSQVFGAIQHGNRGIEHLRRRAEYERPEYQDDGADGDDIDKSYVEDRNNEYVGQGNVRQRIVDRLIANGKALFRDLHENQLGEASLDFDEVSYHPDDNEQQDILRMDNNLNRNNDVVTGHSININSDFSQPMTRNSQELTAKNANYIADLGHGLADTVLTLKQESARNPDSFGQRMDLNGHTIQSNLESTGRRLDSSHQKKRDSSNYDGSVTQLENENYQNMQLSLANHKPSLNIADESKGETFRQNWQKDDEIMQIDLNRNGHNREVVFESGHFGENNEYFRDELSQNEGNGVESSQNDLNRNGEKLDRNGIYNDQIIQQVPQSIERSFNSERPGGRRRSSLNNLKKNEHFQNKEKEIGTFIQRGNFNLEGQQYKQIQQTSQEHSNNSQSRQRNIGWDNHSFRKNKRR